MGREYAVADREGTVLYRTAGYDGGTPSEKIELSGGLQLWISGRDELSLANEELLRQLREAQDANQAKETFMSNMSHDIRTPMNAIIGMTTLAKNHIDEKARVADALDKIEVAGAHLLSLINDVLDMSRINSGRLNLSGELFSLSDLLHDTLIIIRPQMEQKGHAFRVSLGEIFAENLYGDALRLRQIFVNVLNNSVKYTPEGGEIALAVDQERREDLCLLVFRCQDNGIGMTEEFLQRIFDPFERVSSSTISRVEGTGLGMSIVKKLIEAMEGTIGIESRPGAGTTVTIRIPLRFRSEQVSVDALEDRRLLVLEADGAMRRTYERYLGEFGLRYTLVSSSAEAIAAVTDADFRNESYDAVILGKSVGSAGNIFDIAAYLKKSNPQLSLILVSEDNWDEIEYRAGRCGIEHFIPIPVFRKSLINGLNEALRASGGQEEHFASPDLTGRHLLLAEDNEINREIAFELLSVTNASVDTAEDGQQALEKYLGSENGWYDLVLMDIQMPVMDGYTAARQIRASGRPDARTLKIFAMTANAFAEDIAKAGEAGMDGHIAKPIDVNVLMQVLRQLR